MYIVCKCEREVGLDLVDSDQAEELYHGYCSECTLTFKVQTLPD